MKKLKIAATALTLSHLITGCSMISVGEENFSCSGMPGETLCGSATKVYEHTNGEYSPPPAVIVTEDSDGNQTVRPLDDNDENRHIANQNVTAKIPINEDVIPIRTPAQVMRIWIAPWEDESGSLHVTGLVYTEIEKRKWNIGDKYKKRDHVVVHKNHDNARDKDALVKSK